MLNNPDYITARGLLLAAAVPVGTERVPLDQSGGRVLARDLLAQEDTPPFDRSPYDGYALRAADTAGASGDRPVALQVLHSAVVAPGTAVRLATGAPIPEGADVVIQYERTRFTDEHVTLFAPLRAGDNIVRAGEDIRRGSPIARTGEVVGPGLAGMLAAQGEEWPLVYRAPRVGVLSTGGELARAGCSPAPGQIRDSNRYMLQAALEDLGCEAVWLGAAGDSAEEIAALLKRGLRECDAVISTGGVSVGDRDLTPAAMSLARVELLFRGVAMKPGMACACGAAGGKLVCGLSGNPASALTNFYAVVMPALKKLAGRDDLEPRELRVRLLNGFKKASPVTRFLRGRLDLGSGVVGMVCPESQGNTVLSSAAGCDVMAVVPAGSGPLPAGTVLNGFLIA